MPTGGTGSTLSAGRRQRAGEPGRTKAGRAESGCRGHGDTPAGSIEGDASFVRAVARGVNEKSERLELSAREKYARRERRAYTQTRRKRAWSDWVV